MLDDGGLLDDVDATIIKEVERAGRVTFQGLADLVGLSPRTARARLQHLLACGAVRVVAAVHPELCHQAACAYLGLQLADRTGAAASVVAERSGVYFAARTSGPVDGVVLVRAVDDKALMAEMEHIRQVPGVRAVRPFRASMTLRERPVVPGPLQAVALDDLDWRLLAELQRDGRISYAQLAHTIGLSQGATRARVVHLLRSGVVKIHGVRNERMCGPGQMAGFGLAVTGPVTPVAAAAAALPQVVYLATGYGRYDLVGHATATSPARLADILAQISGITGVTTAETWHHLDLLTDLTRADLPLPDISALL